MNGENGYPRAASALEAALERMDGDIVAEAASVPDMTADCEALARLVEERLSDMAAWRERGRA